MLEHLSEITLTLLFVNVLFSIVIFKRRPDLKWFEINLIWVLLVQVSASQLARIYGNNLPLLHLHTWVEFLLISLFYQEILFVNYKINRYFYHFVGLITLLLVCNSMFLEPLTGYNSNAKGLTQIIIISYSVSYFFNRISIDVVKSNLILNQINAAILLYYSGSLFIFTFAKFLAANSEIESGHFWKFNAFMYLVFQILILIATWRLVFPGAKASKSEK